MFDYFQYYNTKILIILKILFETNNSIVKIDIFSFRFNCINYNQSKMYTHTEGGASKTKHRNMLKIKSGEQKCFKQKLLYIRNGQIMKIKSIFQIIDFSHESYMKLTSTFLNKIIQFFYII